MTAPLHWTAMDSIQVEQAVVDRKENTEIFPRSYRQLLGKALKSPGSPCPSTRRTRWRCTPLVEGGRRESWRRRSRSQTCLQILGTGAEQMSATGSSGCAPTIIFQTQTLTGQSEDPPVPTLDCQHCPGSWWTGRPCVWCQSKCSLTEYLSEVNFSTETSR